MVAYRGMGGSRTATQSGVPVTGTVTDTLELILQSGFQLPARDRYRAMGPGSGGTLTIGPGRCRLPGFALSGSEGGQ
jgi:hypothetical protein